MKFLKHLLPPSRPYLVIRTNRPVLTDEQVAETLAGIPEHHPIWLAIQQEIEDLQAKAIAQASHPELADHPGPLAHTAGGIEWLTELLDRLRSQVAAGQKDA